LGAVGWSIMEVFSNPICNTRAGGYRVGGAVSGGKGWANFLSIVVNDLQNSWKNAQPSLVAGS